jgi:hypothetical protein
MKRCLAIQILPESQIYLPELLAFHEDVVSTALFQRGKDWAPPLPHWGIASFAPYFIGVQAIVFYDNDHSHF